MELLRYQQTLSPLIWKQVKKVLFSCEFRQSCYFFWNRTFEPILEGIVRMKPPQTRFVDFLPICGQDPICGQIFGKWKVHKSLDTPYIIFFFVIFKSSPLLRKWLGLYHSKWQTSLKRAIFGFLFWGGSSMEKLRLIRPSWRDWRKSQLTHYPTTQKPFYQFQPNSKKLNAKILPLWVNSFASGWSTGRS